MSKEPTLHDVLKQFDVINARFDAIDKRFDGIDARLDKTDKRLDDLIDVVNEFATSVDRRFDEVDQRFENVEEKMVTKDYLDDKLADLRADLVLLARKGNLKFTQLVEELVERGSLAPKAAKRILALEPFPQS